VYKLANVMADNGGLEVMLKRLASIADTHNSKQLIGVLLKLFGHCIRVKANREKLLDPDLGAIPTLLHCLKICLASGETHGSGGQPSLSELILVTMERLLAEATKYEKEAYCSFASNCVEISDIRTLLEHAVNLKAGTALHQGSIFTKLQFRPNFFGQICNRKNNLYIFIYIS
jgi:E3 ubiquitin-protein ligase UBR4